jgi:hypothetical protein
MCASDGIDECETKPMTVRLSALDATFEQKRKDLGREAWPVILKSQ